MAFNRPSLQEIIARVIAGIETGLSIKLLMRSVLRVVSVAWAGAVHLLHGHISWGVKQIFASTADPDVVRDTHAPEWGISPLGAAYSTGNVTFTGTDGLLIPAETEMQSAAGALYRSTQDVTIAAGVALVPVIAVDAGTASDLAAAQPVGLISPIAGVSSTGVTDSDGIAGGADAETNESLLARVLDRKREPPNGGSARDYIKWAKEVPGVTRAFVYPQHGGLGTVGVAILADNSPGGPTAPDQLIEDTQDHIDDVRPVTADVTVFSPLAQPLALTLDISPDTPAIRAAVAASFADMMRREAEPGKTILLSKIREAVSVAAGENDNAVVSPAANVTVPANKIATVGTITWL